MVNSLRRSELPAIKLSQGFTSVACLKSVLNVKVLVGPFNQALVGGFSLIVKTDGLFAALVEMMI